MGNVILPTTVRQHGKSHPLAIGILARLRKDAELRALAMEQGSIMTTMEVRFNNGVPFTIDFKGEVANHRDLDMLREQTGENGNGGGR